MGRRGTEDFCAETVLRDTLMVETRHYTFAQIHKRYNSGIDP